MIKIEHTHVDGWVSAIRGMRNPMNSWEQSDSGYGCDNGLCGSCGFNNNWCGNSDEYKIGEKDLALMRRLVKAGSDHSKFMRMITVTCDITAPLYWWKEFDTYKVGTVRNSCSTMHKILEKEFSISNFSADEMNISAKSCMHNIVSELNNLRNLYIYKKDEYSSEHLKKIWYSIIQLLPSSYNQKATVQLNYAVLRNMYHGRKNHKLNEWSVDFCNWIKTLPYSELIIGENDE